MNGFPPAALESLRPCACPDDLPIQLGPAQPSLAQPDPTHVDPPKQSSVLLHPGGQGFPRRRRWGPPSLKGSENQHVVILAAFPV